MPPLPPIELLTLAVLADGEQYGYALATAVEARSGGRLTVRPGNLYRVLDRLIERGLVRPSEGPDRGDGTSERRRYYAITPAGREEARRDLGLYARLLRESRGLAGG